MLIISAQLYSKRETPPQDITLYPSLFTEKNAFSKMFTVWLGLVGLCINLRANTDTRDQQISNFLKCQTNVFFYVIAMCYIKLMIDVDIFLTRCSLALTILQ